MSDLCRSNHFRRFSLDYLDFPILRESYSSGSIVQAERVFYLADANYNVTGLVKYNSGEEKWEVAERYTYTPYGVVTYRAADWGAYTASNPQSLYANTTLYTGRTLDVLTSLYYYRARFYDALLERFLSRDPIQADGNQYRYCGNNPVLRADATGMAWREVTCTFDSGTEIWSETVAADTAETAAQACHRRAVGWGWGTAWKVIGAREGPLNGNHQDHAGTYESDYADLAVTKCECQKDAAAAEEACKVRVALRAAGLQTGRNLTSFGEGILGVVAGGAGTKLVVSGAMVGTGWTLIATGIVIAGKGAYDFYVSYEIGLAATAAADRYCNCAAAVVGAQ